MEFKYGAWVLGIGESGDTMLTGASGGFPHSTLLFVKFHLDLFNEIKAYC